MAQMPEWSTGTKVFITVFTIALASGMVYFSYKVEKTQKAEYAQTALEDAAFKKVMGQALAEKGCRVISVKNGDKTIVEVECSDGKVYREQVIKFPFDNE